MTFSVSPSPQGLDPDLDLDVDFSAVPRPAARALRPLVGLVAVAVLSTVAIWQAWTAAAQSVDELRGDIPTREAVRNALDEIADRQDLALGRLTAAEVERDRLTLTRAELTVQQQRLVEAIETGRDSLQRLAVESYITGGDVGTLEYLAAVEDASDFSWRRHLVLTQTGSTRRAVAELDRLYNEADDAVRASLMASDELRAEIESLEVELLGLQDERDRLSETMVAAEAWDRTEIAVAEGRYGLAPNDKWEKMRFCESSDRYDAISPSGKYRGAYQFDLATWETVGGTGDPAAAPPAEQDARARELYARRGWYPWPVCGHFLR